MADINEIRLDQAKKIEEKTLWDCHEHDDLSDKQHIEECLSEMLSAYIGDDRNYVVDGAFVECDQMSRKPVQMYYKDGRLGIKGEGGSAETAYEMPSAGVSTPCFEVNPDEPEICRFHAVNGGQTANGLRFGVVSDRSCLRDKIEKENMEEGKDVASLFSMGNCKIMREADVLEINKRRGRAKIYGTCYCLMKPDWQWINPYCMESVVKGCDTKSLNLNMPSAGMGAELAAPKCYHTSHHKTMKWDTKEGRQEEGLTMMSTLLCTRGGIITFKVSGQIYLDAPADDKNQQEDLTGQAELTISMEYFKFLLAYENAGDSWKFAQDLGDGVITIAFGVVLKTREGVYPLGPETYEKYMDMAARNIPITKEEAYQLTRTHLDSYINIVNSKAQQEGWNLTQNRFDAIVDMVWNIGDTAIKFNATELIATGDLNNPDVKQQLMKEILETAHFEQTNGEEIWSKNLVERRLDVVKIAGGEEMMRIQKQNYQGSGGIKMPEISY